MSDLIARIDEMIAGSRSEPVGYLLRDCKAEIQRLTEQRKTQKEYYENVIEDGVKQIKEQKMKRLEVQGMADCMDMVMQELQGAGIISKDIPPMMLPEAILAKLSAVGEPVAWVQYYMGVTNKFLSVSEYHQAKEEPHQEHYAYVPLYTAPPSVDALIAEIDARSRYCTQSDAEIDAILDKYRSAK